MCWQLTGGFDVDHVLGLATLLGGGVVVVQNIQHRLGVLLLLHLGDVGWLQQSRPWLWHTLCHYGNHRRHQHHHHRIIIRSTPLSPPLSSSSSSSSGDFSAPSWRCWFTAAVTFMTMAFPPVNIITSVSVSIIIIVKNINTCIMTQVPLPGCLVERRLWHTL